MRILPALAVLIFLGLAAPAVAAAEKVILIGPLPLGIDV
jgi:hypothetical protein